MPLWHFDRQWVAVNPLSLRMGSASLAGLIRFLEVVAPRVAPCPRQETESSFRADTVSLATIDVATAGAKAASWEEVGDRAW